MTTPVTIGMADSSTVDLDVSALVGSHMGIVANSGGGKSGLLRKVLETTHGQIQHIVLDSEDEFYTLRERYEYVIAGGEGGDAPAAVSNAAGLARAALTHGFSLICQLNDLGRGGAVEFVDTFLRSMISAPRELWRPCLVVIDEAQRFPAEVIGQLTEAGRKRGFTAVLATQRLPKMDANVRGDINNWVMGRVGQALDKRHIADQLGMSPVQARDELNLDRRSFFAFGPAISRDPVMFKVGDVETTMVKPGGLRPTTPPAPEALREILSDITVQEPEEDVKASNDLPAPHISEKLLKAKDLRIAELEKAIDEWQVEMACGQQQLNAVIAERDALRRLISEFSGNVDRMKVALKGEPMPEAPSKPNGAVAPAPAKPRVVPDSLTGKTAMAEKRKPQVKGDHPPRHQRILDALAWATRMLGKDSVERNIVAWFADTSPKSSSYANDLGTMRTAGLIEYPGGGLLALTQAGGELANWPRSTPTRADLLAAVKLKLEPRHCRLLDAVWAHDDRPVSRKDLADDAGTTATSSSFANDLGKLRTLGLIDYPKPGLVGLGRVLA